MAGAFEPKERYVSLGLRVDGAATTALFVDLDNLVPTLTSTYSSETAAWFASRPQEWRGWLASGAPEVGGSPRRFSVLRVYMGRPLEALYGRAFLEAGFEIDIAPRLTTGGKNATDMRMAMDIARALQHPVRHDEFLILSADADFTPVLQYVREHGRRTAMLAGGHAASIYRGTADLVIGHGAMLSALRGRPAATPPAGSPAPAMRVVPAAAPAPVRPVALGRDDVAERLRRATEAPALTPEQHRAAFGFLSAALDREPYHPSGTVKLARSLAAEAGVGLSRTALERLMGPARRLVHVESTAGHVKPTAIEIALCYRDRLLALAAAGGWRLTTGEVGAVDGWLGIREMHGPAKSAA